MLHVFEVEVMAKRQARDDGHWDSLTFRLAAKDAKKALAGALRRALKATYTVWTRKHPEVERHFTRYDIRALRELGEFHGVVS